MNRPLDLSNLLKHAFLSGIVAARNIPGHEPCDGPALWVDYEPDEHGPYELIATLVDQHIRERT
jgi:hypothetical protein